MDLSTFLMSVFMVCSRHSASVTSWLRTKSRNDSVGGRVDSYHLLGLAVDCVLDQSTVKHAFIHDARRLGLDAIDEGDHVHLEPKR